MYRTITLQSFVDERPMLIGAEHELKKEFHGTVEIYRSSYHFGVNREERLHMPFGERHDRPLEG